jgi:peptidyl-dipeptidase Dcp
LLRENHVELFCIAALCFPGGDGQPTLLSFDDAVTLFHEFGHGLHGMLSKVTYERLSGTSVLKDFVELVGI